MRRFRNKIIGIALIALGGCAAAPPKVAAVDQDTYRLQVSGAPFESQAATNSKALLAANTYCNGRGQKLLFRHSAESGTHTWLPKQEDLTFVCVEPAVISSGTIIARQ